MKKHSKSSSHPSKSDSTPRAAGRVLKTHPPQGRMQRIHALLANGKCYNAPKLAELIEVNVKTIRRDLDYMRDQVGLPVSDYDRERDGFYYTKEVKDFPLFRVTEGELLAMLVAQQALETFAGTPYAHVLQSAFNKLSGALGDEVSFSPADLPGAVSFRSDGIGRLDADLFSAVSKAVLERREVEFNYTKPECDTERRHAQPYHLLWMNRESYLIARDLDRNAMRTFKLVRMEKFKPTKHHFERDPSFDPKKYFGDSFGLFRGEENTPPKRVRIRFSSYAATLVRERFWHESQVLRELPGGELEMELHVANLDEIKRMVLRYCGDAQVIEPPELIAAIREDAKRIAKIHK